MKLFNNMLLKVKHAVNRWSSPDGHTSKDAKWLRENNNLLRETVRDLRRNNQSLRDAIFEIKIRHGDDGK